MLNKLLDSLLDGVLGRVDPGPPLDSSIRARALTRHVPRHAALREAYLSRCAQALEWDDATWFLAVRAAASVPYANAHRPGLSGMSGASASLKVLLKELHLNSAPRTFDFDPAVVLGRALADVATGFQEPDATLIDAFAASFDLAAMGPAWHRAWSRLDAVSDVEAYRVVKSMHTSLSPEGREVALQLLDENWSGTPEELVAVVEGLL